MPQDPLDEAVANIKGRSPSSAPTPLDHLTNFLKEKRLTPGSTTGGKHNRGSKHYDGEAVDVRNSGRFTDAQVKTLSDEAAARGFKLRDERVRPLGQPVWGGPHVHLEVGDPLDFAVSSIKGRSAVNSSDSNGALDAAVGSIRSTTDQINSNTSGDVSRGTLPVPNTPQNRRGAYAARAQEARYPERNPALHKLARDIEWHFGTSVLMKMSELPEEQQRQIAQEATKLAAGDEEKKRRGEPIVESLAWKVSNQQRLNVTGDRIRDRAEMMKREQGLTPEKLEEKRREALALDNPILRSTGAMRWLKDTGALGTAGLLDVVAGAAKMGGRAGSGALVAAPLYEQSAKLREASAEASERRPMGWKGRISRDVGAGLVEFAPLMLIPELGIESVLARIGISAAKGATYTGTQAYGRNESGRDIAKSAAVGGATFGLLGVPLPGKNYLSKALSNLVIVGGGTTVINVASGQSLSEAATQGLVMSLLKAPELLKRVKMEDGRPATEADLRGLYPPEDAHLVASKTQAAINRFQKQLAVEKRAPALMDVTQPEQVSARIKELNDGIARIESELATTRQARGTTGRIKGLQQTLVKRLAVLEGERNALIDPKVAKVLERQRGVRQVFEQRRGRAGGAAPAPPTGGGIPEPPTRVERAELNPAKWKGEEPTSNTAAKQRGADQIRQDMIQQYEILKAKGSKKTASEKSQMGQIKRILESGAPKWKGQKGTLDFGEVVRGLDDLRKKFPNLSDIELRAMLEKERPLSMSIAGRDKKSLSRDEIWSLNQTPEEIRSAIAGGHLGPETQVWADRAHQVADSAYATLHSKASNGMISLKDAEALVGKSVIEGLDRRGDIKLWKEAPPYTVVMQKDVVAPTLDLQLPSNKPIPTSEVLREQHQQLLARAEALQLSDTKHVRGWGPMPYLRKALRNIDYFPDRTVLELAKARSVIEMYEGKSGSQLTFEQAMASGDVTKINEYYDRVDAAEANAKPSFVDRLVEQKTERRGPDRKPQADWLDMTPEEQAANRRQMDFDAALATGDMAKIREHFAKVDAEAKGERPLAKPRGTKSIRGMGTPGTKKVVVPVVEKPAVVLPEPPTSVIDPATGRKVFKVSRPQAVVDETPQEHRELSARAESLLVQNPHNDIAKAALGYLKAASNLLAKGPQHADKVNAALAKAKSLIESVESGGIEQRHSGYDPRPALRALREKFPELSEIELRAMIKQGEQLRQKQIEFRDSLRKPEGVLKAEAKLSPSSAIEDRNSGFNPVSAVRAADKLERPGFTIDRGTRGGFSFMDRFRTPLSNLDFTGTYERRGGVEGKAASDAVRTAQLNISENTFKWEKQLGEVSANLEAARGNVPKAKFYADFIDLIEKSFNDPTRTSTNPQINDALKLHDKLTSEWRNYIIETRRGLGIDMPDNWGITDRGYIRHLFLGNIQLFKVVNGVSHFIDSAETYGAAQKIALEEIKKNPNVEIHAKAMQNFPGDVTVRVSTRKFWRTVNELLKSTKQTQTAAGGTITLTKADILEDIRGTVGQQSSKVKPFGALLKRQGFDGASTDYMHIMETHAGQLARTQELSKLNRELTPIIEKIRGRGQIGLANRMKAHLDDLWGTPTQTELDIGDSIRGIPILRNHVANPDFAMRQLARQLSSLQTILKLDFNLRASFVNTLDPLATLWPYTTTREFAGLYADYMKPATRAMLRDKGVLQGSTKFTEGVAQHGKKTFSQRVADLRTAEGLKEKAKAVRDLPPRPFRAASDLNRGVGYLYGLKDGTRRGLTGDALHSYGLDWARKVEFDNSIYNVAPILRSPTGRVLGQFKGYPLKALENWGTMWKQHEGDTAITRATRQAKFAGSRIAIGGVKALVPGPVRAVAEIALGTTGYFMVVALSKQMQNSGMSKDDADKAAQAVYYGAPAMMGQDLSASVAVVDDLYGKSPEEKLVNFLGGPTVGFTFGLGKAIATENPEKIATAVSPYAKGVNTAIELAERGKATVPVARGERMELTDFEAVMRVLGFTPVRQSIEFDKPPKKDTKDTFIQRLRDGDTGVIKDALSAMEDGTLTEKDVREVVSQSKGSELQNSFKRLTLSQAEYIYSGMSKENQKEVLPWLLLKRKNKGSPQ